MGGECVGKNERAKGQTRRKEREGERERGDEPPSSVLHTFESLIFSVRLIPPSGAPFFHFFESSFPSVSFSSTFRSVATENLFRVPFHSSPSKSRPMTKNAAQVTVTLTTRERMVNPGL